MEAVWDHLLTMGKRIYGIAVDDAHHFQGEFAPEGSNPGRGWVVVRAEVLKRTGSRPLHPAAVEARHEVAGTAGS